MAFDCDVNNIMAKYRKTGVFPEVRPGQPVYADFSTTADYHTSLNQVIEAQEAFDLLPAHIRERMGNDPGALIDFVNDPANQEEGEQLGLFKIVPKPPAKIVPNPPSSTPEIPKSDEKPSVPEG